MKLHRLLLLALIGSVLSGCSRSTPRTPDAELSVVDSLRKKMASNEKAVAGGSTVAMGTGWGTIKGVFKLDGAPPALNPLSTGGKDMEVCGQSVKNEDLVVDPASKGIANVLIFARKVSRIHPDAKEVPAAPAEFDQKSCLFLTHVLAVRAKQTILLKNSDPVGHNTAISPIGQNGTNSTIPSQGSLPYKIDRGMQAPTSATCSIHAWMKAWVIARDDPYFAVTGPDGSFEIKNVPAGEKVEFLVWHERSAKGIPVRGGKGQFAVTIPENGVEDLKDIAVPVAVFN